MTIQTKYTNDLGITVTDQQLSTLRSYKKITIDTGVVKMIERFWKTDDMTFKIVNYFLSKTENKQEIVERFSDIENDISCRIYFNKQSQNGFDLWEYEEYTRTTEIVFKGKEVFDSNNRMIFSANFDLNTGALLLGATKIYHSGISDNPLNDELLMFSYKEDGSVDLIYDSQEEFGYIKGIYLDKYLADTQFSQVDFPWDQHTYYHNVLPYLPAGSL